MSYFPSTVFQTFNVVRSLWYFLHWEFETSTLLIFSAVEYSIYRKVSCIFVWWVSFNMLLKVDELEFRAICCQGRKRKYNYRHQKRASSPVYVEKWGHGKKWEKHAIYSQISLIFFTFDWQPTCHALREENVTGSERNEKWKSKHGNAKTVSLSLPLFLKRRLAKTFIPRDRDLSGTFWQARKMDGALFSEACVLLTRWQMTALYQGFEKGKLVLFLLFWLFCIQNVQKFRSEKCATYILLTLKSSILWLVKGRQNLKNLEAN